jgi:hypothetical protein
VRASGYACGLAEGTDLLPHDIYCDARTEQIVGSNMLFEEKAVVFDGLLR